MSTSTPEKYPPIADYALIGDCHGAALIHRSGSIDWACIRRFDSGSVFARILDHERGGEFAIAPRGLISTRRRYVDDTMVLETHFVTETGEVRLFDAFAMKSGGAKSPLQQLLRVIEGVRGTVELDVTIRPRFDYGSLRPWLRRRGRGGMFTAIGGDDALVLSAECPLSIDDSAVAFCGVARVTAGTRQRFSLTWQPAHDVRTKQVSNRQIDARLAASIRWWKRWAAHGAYRGRYREQVTRSALVLKTLTTAPTGAIIAAPTTSLPEQIGGARNWDYRYCWIRDSALTVAALCRVGHHEAAGGLLQFIEQATAGHADDMQIMYGCYGERRLNELELPLHGYRGSRPVRVGNAAAEQRQVDVYGELLSVAHIWFREGNPTSHDSWLLYRSAADAAREKWKLPDQGIWEVRSEPRHYVHSKVMCWVALECAIAMAEEQHLEADVAGWRATRDEIRKAICEEGVDPRRGCFVQSFGSNVVDASLLLLPIVGFVKADDPRMIRTVEAIQSDLVREGFVLRYQVDRAPDGLPGDEGCFLMCSFWLAEVLAAQGRKKEATVLFERLLAVANDLGLLSEEYEPRSRQLLGNFPQAFTHVALINTAVALTGGGVRVASSHQPAVRKSRPA